MKNSSLIINAVLALAIIGLYVLHFTNPGNSGQSSIKTQDTLNIAAANGSIVYINLDSVYANYDMYNIEIAKLEEKSQTSEAQLKSKQNSFQKKVEDFQYKAQRQLITRSEAAQLEQSLGQEQQQLYELSSSLQMKLAEEQRVALRKVLNSIMEYLKEIESEQPYQFVLGSTFGDNILYANEDYDISKSVIAGLNKRYKELNEEPEEE